MSNTETHRDFRKNETHNGQEGRGGECDGGHFKKISNCGPSCQEAASPEIASQSLVSVTRASDMPAGRD